MSLEITVNGIKFPNPFLLGSGPPGTNARVIAKSFDAGWGGVVAKTVSLESAKVVNVVPRYGRLRSRETNEIIGFENIELISDRPIDVWLQEFREIKKEYPNHILIASIMEEYEKSRWQELTRMVQETGVDGFELNTLRPMPTVEGYTVPGGYSCQAVRPIALRMVSQLARALPEGVTISGIGGIENSHDALEFMLLGASTVQLCTGVMLHGIKIIDELKEGMAKFMTDKGFETVEEIVGKRIPFS